MGGVEEGVVADAVVVVAVVAVEGVCLSGAEGAGAEVCQGAVCHIGAVGAGRGMPGRGAPSGAGGVGRGMPRGAWGTSWIPNRRGALGGSSGRKCLEEEKPEIQFAHPGENQHLQHIKAAPIVAKKHALEEVENETTESTRINLQQAKGCLDEVPAISS